MKRAGGRGGAGQKKRTRRGERSQQLKLNLKSMLTQFSLIPSQDQQQQLQQKLEPSLPNSDSSRFQKVLESDSSHGHFPQSSKHDVADSAAAAVSGSDDKDFILSQDFFCTPDYITPECQNLFNSLDGNKENIPCPASPEKFKPSKSKRLQQDCFVKSPESLSDSQQIVELSTDTNFMDDIKTENATTVKRPSYVSQSAVALRCRVMPPPCIKNPYVKDASETDIDPFGCWRSKCSGYSFSASAGADSLSRYQTDFQEIEQIGNGNFSRVFKVLKRIDGCMYAVKHSTRQLHQDAERRKALMEVQALAALGFHENVVSYYTSWFESDKLYIQMELCDYSLSVYKSTSSLTQEEVLKALYQIAKALQFIHGKGIAHLDVKPDNIYVKKGVYKLGDFGCATMLDNSLPIEEGDARYMPQEILNENYDDLDKVDIFSLGVSIYELLRGSSFPDGGHQLLREGKLSLLPTNSLQLQTLLKMMMDPNSSRRPSAREIVEHPLFARLLETQKSK